MFKRIALILMLSSAAFGQSFPIRVRLEVDTLRSLTPSQNVVLNDSLAVRGAISTGISGTLNGFIRFFLSGGGYYDLTTGIVGNLAAFDTTRYPDWEDTLSTNKLATKEFVRLYFPNIADTSKYLESASFGTMASGDSTYWRTTVNARIPYSDTTSVVAMQWELDGKAALSHTHSIGNVTALQDSLTAKLNRSEATSLLGAKIPYSDTTSAIAMQWELDGKQGLIANLADTSKYAETGQLGSMAYADSAKYHGSASITTVGTIGSGTWQGNAISPTYLASEGSMYYADSAYWRATVNARIPYSDTTSVVAMQWELDGKSAIGHTHTQSNITGLTDSIAAKPTRTELSTLLSAKLNYSDTTSTVANQWRLNAYATKASLGTAAYLDSSKVATTHKANTFGPDQTFSGDIAVNGGDITTTASTLNIGTSGSGMTVAIPTKLNVDTVNTNLTVTGTLTSTGAISGTTGTFSGDVTVGSTNGGDRWVDVKGSDGANLGAGIELFRNTTVYGQWRTTVGSVTGNIIRSAYDHIWMNSSNAELMRLISSTGALTPGTSGNDLGSSSYRWSGFMDTVNVSGGVAVGGNLNIASGKNMLYNAANPTATIWVDGKLGGATTGGALNAAVETTFSTATNSKVTAWRLENTNSAVVSFPLIMPDNWDGGTVDISVYWWTSGTSTGDSVSLSVATASWGNGESGGTVGGDVNKSCYGGGLGGADKLRINTWLSQTISGSPSTGHEVYVNVCRATGYAGDSWNGNVYIRGVRVKYGKSSISE